MPNIKPIALSNGHISKEEIKAREEIEQQLKGDIQIEVKPPKELSSNGKKLYKHIISLLPSGFLAGGDIYCVCIVAESLDRMQNCQAKLNTDGLFTKDGQENQAVRTYEKYSKIFEKFSSKIGLSPKDRAGLAVLNLNEKENQEDPLLKILRGDGD